MDFDKEIVMATLKDILKEVDIDSDKRNYGYIYLWNQNRKNVKEYFSIVFKYLNAQDVANLLGCSVDFIRSTRRTNKKTPMPFDFFIKLLKVKQYFIVITCEEPEEMF